MHDPACLDGVAPLLPVPCKPGLPKLHLEPTEVNSKASITGKTQHWTTLMLLFTPYFKTCCTGNCSGGGGGRYWVCPKSLKGCLFFQCFRRQSQTLFSTEEQLLIKKPPDWYWKIALNSIFGGLKMQWCRTENLLFEKHFYLTNHFCHVRRLLVVLSAFPVGFCAVQCGATEGSFCAFLVANLQTET